MKRYDNQSGRKHNALKYNPEREMNLYGKEEILKDIFECTMRKNRKIIMNKRLKVIDDIKKDKCN